MNQLVITRIISSVTILVFFVTIRAAFAIALSQNSQPVWSYGTLIVTVPNREGLLICGDRRRYNKIQGVLDDETKVFRIGATAGFAHVGARSILSPVNFSKLYDVTDIVVHHFRNRDLTQFEDHLTSLEHAIQADFAAYKQKGGLDWDDAAFSTDRPHYMYIFFYINQQGAIRVVKMEIRYNRRAAPALEMIKLDVTAESLRAARAEGQTEVIAEIISGKDNRFDDLRNNSLVRLFRHMPDRSVASVNDSISFAKLLVESTNTRNHLISAIPTMVSEKCDCALMTGKIGFEWIAK